jgi:lipoyl(octanoyl) transferase
MARGSSYDGVMADLLVSQLGLLPYNEALELQTEVRAARIDERIDDTLLLLEHTPVVTRGRRTKDNELGLGEEFLRSRGVDVITTDRGGYATYHGPGMLVGYVIAGAPDIQKFLRQIERAIIAALAEEGVPAHQRPSTPEENLTGVWVGDESRGEHRKIASLGLHVSHGITMHGFAIGADNDLEPWSWFTPCGLPSAQMTSVGAETGRDVTLPCLRKRVAAQLAHELGLRQRLISRERLEARIAEPAGATAHATMSAAIQTALR